MSERPPRIMISAGEPSGDRLAAGLARALRELEPQVELLGMGGERLQEAGVRIVQPMSEISVVGIVEVLRHLPSLRRAMGRLQRALRDERPDLLVPVDFPDFHLRLAARAGRLGVPVVYFVSPQLWAWRPGRVHRIRRLVRRMLVLFEFETELYESAGVPVTFVGHPLAETGPSELPKEELCRKAGLQPRRAVVALLPGSRRGEIGRMLPILLDAAERLRRTHPDVQFLIPQAPDVPREVLAGPVESSGLRHVAIHSGDFPEVLSICGAGAVTAGTASLEAATVGLPGVVVYRMNPLTYRLARALARVEHAALPNLIAGKEVIPELIQADCRPERIAEMLAVYLDDPASTARIRARLREVRHRLGEPGVYERAARAVLGELAPSRDGGRCGGPAVSGC